MQLSQYWWKIFAFLSAVFLMLGAYFSFTTPPDYQQGLSVRILFLHVPAAWMAMVVYGFMASAAIAAFIWRAPLADIAAQRIALIGAVWVSIALVSGSLWGKPIWGSFWVWDARLVSVLILLFLYLGYIAIIKTIDDEARRLIVARLVAIIGAINLPIIKFSVDWWNTLHQPASIMRLKAPALAPVFLLPLALMAFAALSLTICLLLIRMRASIIRHQLEAQALGSRGLNQ